MSLIELKRPKISLNEPEWAQKTLDELQMSLNKLKGAWISLIKFK